MDALMAMLLEKGISFAILGVVFWAIYRATTTAWATFTVWGQRLLDHWLASANARDVTLATRASDERVGQVLEILSAHELSDQQRHADLREHMIELAQKNRHDMRNALQPLIGLARADEDPTPPT
jgi:hypothetical protein